MRGFCQAVLVPMVLCSIEVGCTTSNIPPPVNPPPPELRLPVGLEPGVEFLTGSPGLELISADWNGDGVPDLIVPLLGGGISVLENASTTGNISFIAIALVADQKPLLSVDVNDFNADGKPDLLTLDTDSVASVWLRQTGDALSLAHTLECGLAGGCAFDKVNGDDQTMDIVVADSKRNHIGVLYFQDVLTPWNYEPVVVNPGTRLVRDLDFSRLVMQDLDRNNQLDALMIDELGGLIEVFMKTQGLPAPTSYYNDLGDWVPAPPGMIFPLDTTSYSPTLIEAMPGARTMSVAVGDLNADGLDDLAVLSEAPGAGTYSQPCIWRGELPATSPASYYVSVYSSSLRGGAAAYVRVLQAELDSLVYFPGWIHDVELADVNNDQKLDLVGISDVAETGQPCHLFYFPGNGDYTFDAPLAFETPLAPLRLSVADYDSDGHQDVAVLNPLRNEVIVYRNDGNSGLGDVGAAYSLLDPPI